jgi:hypothetical protein
MDLGNNEVQKLIKTFCVVGIEETKITKYKEEDNNMRFVQDIDIIKKKMKINVERVENENEKWYIIN